MAKEATLIEFMTVLRVLGDPDSPPALKLSAAMRFEEVRATDGYRLFIEAMELFRARGVGEQELCYRLEAKCQEILNIPPVSYAFDIAVREAMDVDRQLTELVGRWANLEDRVPSIKLAIQRIQQFRPELMAMGSHRR